MGTKLTNLYFRDVRPIKHIPNTEEAELAIRIRAGDRRALDKLVTANLRFVISACKGYCGKGLSFSDLINEGNIGLIKAAHRFDETRGYRFISYAGWWIKQSISAALAEQGKSIRRVRGIPTILNRASVATRKLTRKLQRKPTFSEIAEEAGYKESEINRAMSVSRTFSSLDEPVHGKKAGSRNTLGDLLADKNAQSPDEQAEKRALKKEVNRILSVLSDRERGVLQRYFGIGYANRFTLEAIAKMQGVSREMIRQIKRRALTKLKHSKQILPIMELGYT